MNYIEIIKECYSYSDLCRMLNISNNGAGIRKVKKIIDENKLDISHFDNGYAKRDIKYVRVIKKCPVCDKDFETLSGHKREKTTCSHSCSNTFYRSGSNNPNWKEESTQYRNKCFEFHKKECIICKEDKIVEVHHLDENRENNKIDNLVPLCPTHHKYLHSNYRYLIEDKVNEYIKDFIKLRYGVMV